MQIDDDDVREIINLLELGFLHLQGTPHLADLQSACAMEEMAAQLRRRLEKRGLKKRLHLCE
jgi:hypothetical protein